MDRYWKQFKSGTDIRGIACQNGDIEINLTDEVIMKMAAGFALWLTEYTGMEADALTVAVGHDSRISAERIKTAVIGSLMAAGISVLDIGLASTPAIFMTTVDLDCDAAVQITASHHPWERNGLKFFTKNGGLNGSDISTILEYASEDKKTDSYADGSCKTVDYMDQYAVRLREVIKKGVNAGDYGHPLKGFKIVVDAGNGAGGFYASKVLAPLGADTAGSQFLEPNGMFPNHIPNPENEEAMQSVLKATTDNNADLGIIFDTDVDRAGCVDASGREINRNRLIALASAIALDGNKGGAIVTDSITSSGLKTFIEQDLGGMHHRFRRGYKNVINEAIRLNNNGVNCPLAIETSGHAALRENYFLDDGAYLITKIVIKMALLKKEGKTLDDLFATLKEPAEEAELRFNIKEGDFKSYGNKVISGLNNYAKSRNWDIAPDNHEGIRVSFGDGRGNGWFLLRLSVHDPIMPLNFESDVKGGNKIIAKSLMEYLKDCDGLDTASLKEFIGE